MTIETNKAGETFDVGFKMGSEAGKGQVVCLSGELGVGKTVFVQGFAQGLGIHEPICSPTFTIIQEYQEGRLPLYHFDVYRLGSEEEMEEIGYEEYFYGDGVCLVEWGDLFPDLFPNDTIYVKIEKNLEKGFDYRVISIESRKPHTDGNVC